jgi:hypothetical protein
LWLWLTKRKTSQHEHDLKQESLQILKFTKKGFHLGIYGLHTDFDIILGEFADIRVYKEKLPFRELWFTKGKTSHRGHDLKQKGLQLLKFARKGFHLGIYGLHTDFGVILGEFANIRVCRERLPFRELWFAIKKNIST